tara:strand:- start:344 stop:763 length:420 start_codon:yes stop_codon:yes gene_type:complete
MKYISYGSNLNLEQMRFRCPNAKPLGKMLLPNFSLVFRGVADIEEKNGLVCPVGVWDITKKCEQALDRYEGYPHLYSKIFFKLDDELAMTYVMNTNRVQPPSKSYFQSIEEGYDNFGLDKKYLFEARKNAYKESKFTLL